MTKRLWLERSVIIAIWIVYLLGRLGLLGQQMMIPTTFFQMAPAFMTAEWFVWILVDLLLVSLTLMMVQINFVQKGQRDLYQLFIRPFYVQALFFTLGWIISWLRGMDLISFLIAVFLGNTTLNMIRLISGKMQLRQQNWLRLPLGIAMGVAQAILMMSLAVFTNVRISPTVEIWATIALIIALIASAAFVYVKYGNELVMLPTLVYLCGLLIRWFGQDLYLASIAGASLIIALSLYIYFFYLQRKQLKAEKIAK